MRLLPCEQFLPDNRLERGAHLVSPGYHGEADYWASKTRLTIEHENGFDVETEMWKLAHWRSDLSVLVFYDFAEIEFGDAPAGDPGLPGCDENELA